MEHIADTLDFFPEHNKIPVISNQDELTNEALDMIEAISKPYPTAPFVSIGADKIQAIRKMAYILKQKTTSQKSPHKETAHTRVEAINNNPRMTTASLRVKITV